MKLPAPVRLRAPVIVSPALATLLVSVPVTPVSCEPLPKNAEAVTEDAVVTKLPAQVRLSAPVIVSPALATLVLLAALAVTPVRPDPLPKKADAVTEDAVVMKLPAP